MSLILPILFAIIAVACGVVAIALTTQAGRMRRQLAEANQLIEALRRTRIDLDAARRTILTLGVKWTGKTSLTPRTPYHGR